METAGPRRGQPTSLNLNLVVIENTPDEPPQYDSSSATAATSGASFRIKAALENEPGKQRYIVVEQGMAINQLGNAIRRKFNLHPTQEIKIIHESDQVEVDAVAELEPNDHVVVHLV
eukprot:m.57751 g.57751  ORF g.57751 m.57751 type:complete len:117 (-) comp13745_c0_seq1:107-457(-)